MRQPDDGDVRFLEIHVQAAQHRVGSGGIIHHEPGQAFTMLDERLKGQNVYPTLPQCQTTLPQSARFIFNRYSELLRPRHATRFLSIADQIDSDNISLQRIRVEGAR